MMQADNTVLIDKRSPVSPILFNGLFPVIFVNQQVIDRPVPIPYGIMAESFDLWTVLPDIARSADFAEAPSASTRVPTGRL
jgi:hypothetical protein